MKMLFCRFEVKITLEGHHKGHNWVKKRITGKIQLNYQKGGYNISRKFMIISYCCVCSPLLKMVWILIIEEKFNIL